MPRFEGVLRSVAGRLGLPQPERVRVLEEISGDLEELRVELIRRGMSKTDAEAEAIALLAPSETAMAALVSVHESLYGSLVRRFSSRMRLAEWAGLVAVTVGALGVVLSSLWGTGLLRNPSTFLLPVLVTAVAIVGVAGRKAIQLYLERDHDPDRLRSRMATLLALSATAIGCSLAGVVCELFLLASRVEVAPQHQGALVLPWLLDTSVLVGAGLTTALIGGLFWFLLLQKISAVERAELRTMRAAGRVTTAPSFPLEHTLTQTGAHR